MGHVLVMWVNWKYRIPHKDEHAGSIPAMTTKFSLYSVTVAPEAYTFVSPRLGRSSGSNPDRGTKNKEIHMNRYPNIEETVKVLRYIGPQLDDDRIGKVLSRDGEYIIVELDKSKVQVECYMYELEEI